MGISQCEPSELQLCSFRWHWSDIDRSGPQGDPKIGPQLPQELIAQSVWCGLIGNTSFSSAENKKDSPFLSGMYSFSFVSSHLQGVYPPKIFFIVDLTTTKVFSILEQSSLKFLLRKPCSLALKISETCLSLWPADCRTLSIVRYYSSAKFFVATSVNTGCDYLYPDLSPIPASGKYCCICSPYLLTRECPVGQTACKTEGAYFSACWSSHRQFSKASSNSFSLRGYSLSLSSKTSSSRVLASTPETSSPVFAANFSRLQFVSTDVSWWENRANSLSIERLMVDSELVTWEIREWSGCTNLPWISSTAVAGLAFSSEVYKGSG